MATPGGTDSPAPGKTQSVSRMRPFVHGSVHRARPLPPLFFLLLLLAALVLGACGRGRDRLIARKGELDVLLVTVEGLDPGSLEALPEGAALAMLARNGVRFEDAVSASPDPLAALASLLTSARPSSHGVSAFRDEPLDDRVTTIAEALAARGFLAAAALSGSAPAAARGLARGIETVAGGAGGPSAIDPASATDAAIGARSMAPPKRRLFRWVHFGGADLDVIDREVGRLVADATSRGGKGLSATLAVVAGSRAPDAPVGDPRGRFILPDAALRTVLVLAGTGALPGGGKRTAALASALDLAPTILDALSIGRESAFQGASLVPLVFGGEPVRAHAPVEADEPFGTIGLGSLRGAVTRAWVYAETASGSELRRRDASGSAPGPDLAESHPGVAGEMRRRLRDRGIRRSAAAARGEAVGPPPVPAAEGAEVLALHDAAREAVARGEIGLAIERLLELSAASPSAAPVKALLGSVLLEAGDVAGAAREAGAALRIDEDDPDAHALEGRVALRARDLHRAERSFVAAAGSRPRSPGAAAEVAETLLRLGRAEEAARELERAVALDPTSAHRRVALARAYLAVLPGSPDGASPSRGHGKAVEQLRAAVALRPDLLAARLGLADALADGPESGLGEAIAHLEVASSIDPSSAALVAKLASLFERAGDAARARAEFRRAADLDPKSAEARLGLARLAADPTGDEALEAYEAALALDPDLVAARLDLGRLLLERGEVERGLRELEIAAERRPLDAGRLARLGSALAAAGRPHAAEDAYRRALAIDGGDLFALLALSRLLAAGGEGFGRPVEAVELARKAVTMHPSAEAAWGGYGLALEAAGRMKEAAEARLERARLLVRAGRPKDALDLLSEGCESADRARLDEVRRLAETSSR